MTVNAALLRLAELLAGADVEVVDGCEYCFGADGLASLRGPLTGISSDVVSRVATRTPDHWGDFSALHRKLTPRIMAMLVAGELPEVSLIADRFLQSGCWTSWRSPEREAMLDVCRQWWLDTLSTHPRSPSACDVIEFLATTPVPLPEWLAEWDAQPPGSADAHAVDLCRLWLPALIAGELDVGFVADVQIAGEMSAWVLESGVERVARTTDDPLLWLLIDELRNERHAQ